MKAVATDQIGVSKEVVLPATVSDLGRSLIGDNFDSLPDAKLQQSRETLYAARTVNYSSVDLVRLPAGICLFGRHFLLKLGDELVQEQMPPPHILSDPETAWRECTKLTTVGVEVPCIVVSRYGLMVWGHWVGELLPRLLLAERMFPGRFRYVLPGLVLASSSPRNVWNSIWDTIRAAGVTSDRIIAPDESKNYVFSNLYSMSSILQKQSFHPGGLAAFRDVYLPNVAPKPNRRIALLRTEAGHRRISNLPDVIRLLREHDFEFVEVGRLPFAEQVHLFASSALIVGVLSSALTGLLFAPEKVHVLSLAQEGYLNSFFYPMMQARSARYYDVRGPITARSEHGDVFSDFQVEPAAIETALAALGSLQG